jgi:hypothetical protein
MGLTTLTVGVQKWTATAAPGSVVTNQATKDLEDCRLEDVVCQPPYLGSQWMEMAGVHRITIMGPTNRLSFDSKEEHAEVESQPPHPSVRIRIRSLDGKREVECMAFVRTGYDGFILLNRSLAKRVGLLTGHGLPTRNLQMGLTRCAVGTVGTVEVVVNGTTIKTIGVAEVLLTCDVSQDQPVVDGMSALGTGVTAGVVNATDPVRGGDPVSLEEAVSVPGTRQPGVANVAPREQFHMRFKSASRMPDGRRSFQINVIRSNRTETYFRLLGEVVEGYRLTKFEEKSTVKAVGGPSVSRETDASELTLEGQGRIVVLVKGEDMVTDLLSSSKNSDVTGGVGVPGR